MTHGGDSGLQIIRHGISSAEIISRSIDLVDDEALCVSEKQQPTELVPAGAPIIWHIISRILEFKLFPQLNVTFDELAVNFQIKRWFDEATVYMHELVSYYV